MSRARNRHRSAVLVGVLSIAAACSTAPHSPDLAADEQAIRDLSARWQKALLDRDAATQAAMFANDGVSYHDGQEPLVGPSAILAWESRSATQHPKAVISSTTDRIQIAASGDLAIQTGEGSLTNLGEAGEDHVVHRQRFVTVWKKVDGQWKVAHDIAVNITPW
ncbi:MAG TPA: nuclear transport factor 2 family protein [Vicinamibacterales bacterium]|nr:nuclear transport factor 2 family protein [Vicinamibacterales bacterium]